MSSDNTKPAWALAKEIWPQTDLYKAIADVRSPLQSVMSGKPLTAEEQAAWDARIQRYKEEDAKNQAAWADLLCFDEKSAKRWNGWPMTIQADRYGGCYSHGKYVAWPLELHNVPESHANGGDNEAMSFWDWARDSGACIGVGSTPTDAFEDLKSKVVRAAEGKSTPAP